MPVSKLYTLPLLLPHDLLLDGKLSELKDCILWTDLKFLCLVIHVNIYHAAVGWQSLTLWRKDLWWRYDLVWQYLALIWCMVNICWMNKTERKKEMCICYFSSNQQIKLNEYLIFYYVIENRIEIILYKLFHKMLFMNKVFFMLWKWYVGRYNVLYTELMQGKNCSTSSIV